MEELFYGFRVCASGVQTVLNHKLSTIRDLDNGRLEEVRPCVSLRVIPFADKATAAKATAILEDIPIKAFCIRIGGTIGYFGGDLKLVYADIEDPSHGLDRLTYLLSLKLQAAAISFVTKEDDHKSLLPHFYLPLRYWANGPSRNNPLLDHTKNPSVVITVDRLDLLTICDETLQVIARKNLQDDPHIGPQVPPVPAPAS